MASCGKPASRRPTLGGMQDARPPPQQRRKHDATRTIKEDLRRRCLMRAAAQRQALLAQHRQAADAISMAAIVADEVRRTRTGSDAARPSAWSEADEALLQVQLGREAYLELMAETEEMLLHELQQHHGSSSDTSAESAMTHEYEDYLAAESDLLEHLAAVDSAASPPFTEAESESSILCPLCLRARVTQTADGAVACAAAGDGCALYLDARGHPDPVGLLRTRMEALLREHGQRCSGAPQCRLPLPTERPLGMLLFCCTTCGLVTGVV